LSPSSESIQALIDDFKNVKEPQYRVVHLFFTRRVPKDELEKLKHSSVVKFIRTLKELNLEFLAYESQVIHLDMPESFYNVFSPESKVVTETQKEIAEKVVSICATLREYPIIRFSTSLPVAAAVARNVQSRLDELLHNSQEYAENRLQNRATLLVLDRSHDILSPVLHEFTYQAMVYDLLPIKNDIYKYEASTSSGERKVKEASLSEYDPLWPALRHQHIADTIDQILEEFQEFVKENKASQFYANKKINSLADMSEAMKAMPQYQEMLGKYSLHINLAAECMKIFTQKNLAKVAGLEQDMATGEEADGKPAKNILSNLPTLLQSLQTKEDKIRLLITYIVSQEGIKDADRRRLLEFASISNEDENSIANLRYLGITLTKPPQAKNKQKVKEKKKKKSEENVPSYELSRYVPVLKKTLEDIGANSLSTTEFPFVREGDPSSPGVSSGENAPSSLRSQPRWAEKGKRKSSKGEKPTTLTGPRILIFIVGGVTFAEMRVAYEMTTKLNREVVVMSTHILTPNLFIEQLRSLKKFETV